MGWNLALGAVSLPEWEHKLMTPRQRHLLLVVCLLARDTEGTTRAGVVIPPGYYIDGYDELVRCLGHEPTRSWRSRLGADLRAIESYGYLRRGAPNPDPSRLTRAIVVRIDALAGLSHSYKNRVGLDDVE
jgi:hypothetical protein